MERKIARFNERITIQKNETVVDKYGNHKNLWNDYYSCYAYASTYQYDRERESAVTEEERTINFEVRFCSELAWVDSVHYRVVFHGRVYDIQTIDFMNYQKWTIRIVCKLEGRHGKEDTD